MGRHNKHRKQRHDGHHRHGRGRLGRGITGTAAAAAAMVALTASQGPGFGSPPAGDGGGSRPAPQGGKLPLDQPGDGEYHTELPPLAGPAAGSGGGPAAPSAVPDTLRGGDHAGIPATVLAAYRRAEASVRRTDPGCRLPWELLAAIGKVESGHARGGAVDANGTTLTPILGPQLNGAGFANIADTDGGSWDGDAAYDRAVGPMQFIPSTWAGWAADGNGDGTANPNNVFDAALAAAHYLCAGGRDLSDTTGLHAAILSYNHSESYLRTVLAWLDFYRRGTHAVPDGTGVLPESPGAGSGKGPAGGGGPGTGGSGGGGIDVGDTPPRSPSEPGPGGGPGGSGGGGSGGPGDPSDDPPDPGPGPGDPSGDPSEPGGDPSDPGTGDPSDPGPGDPSDPGECESDGPTPSPTPTGTPSPGEPCDDDGGSPSPSVPGEPTGTADPAGGAA